MRLKFKTIVSLSSTTAEEKDIFNRDPNTIHEVSDSLPEGSVRTIKIPNGAEDQEIDFGGVDDVRFLYIVSDRQIIIRVNGGAEQTLAIIDGFDKAYHLTTSLVTSLMISNSSGYSATVNVYLVGDPV